jgi:hypothetical protein
MKKSLIITLVLLFVLGISATAFAAANPFGDVPAKHWAYDAINQLYKAGIVDGDQGKYLGDKTMTRYEMAQVVAKAMFKEDKADQATKAVIEKLAVEFAAELNNLGVRVAKLEANQPSVTWNGNDQIRYLRYSKSPATHFFQNQLLLWANAKVNDDIALNMQYSTLRQATFGTPGQDKYGNQNTWVTQANAKVNNFFGQSDTTFTLGRFYQPMGATRLGIFLQGVDGAKIAFGNKVKAELGYANFKNSTTYFGQAGGPTWNNTVGPFHEIPGQMYVDNAVFATVSYAVAPTTTLVAEYMKNQSRDYKKAVESATTTTKLNLWGVGFSTALGDDFTLKGDYMRNQAYSNNNTALYGQLFYKMANLAKPNSYDVSFSYAKAYIPASFGWNDFNTTSGGFNTSNIQCYALTLDYILAKNVNFKFVQSFNSKDPVTGAPYALGEWTRVHVQFNF